MNLGRLALAAVAATVVDAVYGFVVYGVLLVGEFARYPGVYRSNEAGMAYLPLMFFGIFVAIAALTLIYAKGYEGGSGVAEGFRFGVLVGDRDRLRVCRRQLRDAEHRSQDFARAGDRRLRRMGARLRRDRRGLQARAPAARRQVPAV